MKRLLLVIALISAIQAIDINAQPITADAEFFTKSNIPASGDLKALVSEGNPPYTFEVEGIAKNGTVIVRPSGLFRFTLNPETKTGSFDYTATEIDGNSGSGTVTIITQ